MIITPHEYQVRAVKHCLENDKSALFLDLGLGKTVVVLTAVNNLIKQRKIKGALVIAPLRVVYNVWPEEIKKWDHLQHIDYGILHGKDKDIELQIKRDIYITNYESLKWLYSKLRRAHREDIPFDMIIFDESTAIKSRTTKRFKLLRNLIKIFKRRTILTGTPAPNSLLDLWAQYFLLDGGDRLYSSWYNYRDTYFYQADYHGYKWEPLNGSSLKISNKVQDITMRLKAEDYLDMPKRFFNNIQCTMPEALMEKYKQLENEFITFIQSNAVTAANSAVLANKLRQFVAGATYLEEGGWVPIHHEKLDALIDILDNYKSEPVLIAIQFRFEYEVIKKKLPNVPVIYGGVDARTSTKLIKQWNEGRLQQMVVHPLSIAHGVNLQEGGRTIIWYSLPWSYEQYHQLNGRLYRQGQTKPVLINHLMLKDTIDQRVLDILQGKEEEGMTFLNNLTDDLRRTNDIYL